MTVDWRRRIVEPDHAALSIVRQCELLSISWSGFYYEQSGESAETLALMRLIDEAYLRFPYYGSRQMARHLRRLGHVVGRRRTRRLMAKMGLAAIYQKPRTSTPNLEHRIYPYLLRALVIERPNQVWCADITYISMRRGFMYLVAVMDWATRRLLSWRVSNRMEADFCIEALEEALAKYGRPEIFNTDQGSQFTSPRFSGVLETNGIKISMDGRGRWMDSVFIERLWRSLNMNAYIYMLSKLTGNCAPGSQPGSATITAIARIPRYADARQAKYITHVRCRR